MCGIGGVRRFGNQPITGEELTLMLCSLERRGTHATGVALWDAKTGVHIHKAPEPAWKFTKDKAYEEFLNEFLTDDTEIALLHTRLATTGNPQHNENNHPITDGEVVIVHNGMISNHHAIFNQLKSKRSCETDSDVIRAIITEHGITQKGVRELGKMAGSAAIAVLDTRDPGKLLLARSGSPLVYGFSPDASKLYWASEPEPIVKASRPWHEIRGVWVQDTHVNISIGSMADNSAWVFGPEQLIFHDRFPVCSHYFAPDYSRIRQGYHAKTRGWKKEAEREKAREKTAEKTTAKGTTGTAQGQAKAALAIVSKKTDEEKPLKNSVMQCDSCGEPVMNVAGVPWEVIDCPRCNNKVFTAD